MTPAHHAVVMMPSLDPGIHGSSSAIALHGALDCRVTAGNDNARWNAGLSPTGLGV
jgi:hypothetical protein